MSKYKVIKSKINSHDCMHDIFKGLFLAKLGNIRNDESISSSEKYKKLNELHDTTLKFILQN